MDKTKQTFAHRSSLIQTVMKTHFLFICFTQLLLHVNAQQPTSASETIGDLSVKTLPENPANQTIYLNAKFHFYTPAAYPEER